MRWDCNCGVAGVDRDGGELVVEIPDEYWRILSERSLCSPAHLGHTHVVEGGNLLFGRIKHTFVAKFFGI